MKRMTIRAEERDGCHFIVAEGPSPHDIARELHRRLVSGINGKIDMAAAQVLVALGWTPPPGHPVLERQTVLAPSPQLTRPALRYHGGKWRLAPWIISHFPPHRVYVEPFGGAGSVLLRKPRAYSEVYNDRWRRVVDLFSVLRDPAMAAELRRRLELTPFARDEFEASDEEAHEEQGDIIERARMTVVRSFMGHGSESTRADSSTGFRSNSNRSHTTPAHDWSSWPAVVPAFVERMRGVVIENQDAAVVMRRHDGPETLHYCDPPYPHSTRTLRHGYAFEMTDAEHEALAEAIANLSGMVIVSGYRCDLYDSLYAGWRRVETEALADGARKRTEVLWINAAAAAALDRHALPLFSGN